MQLVKSLAMAMGALVVLGVSAVSASAATCAVSTRGLKVRDVTVSEADSGARNAYIRIETTAWTSFQPASGRS